MHCTHTVAAEHSIFIKKLNHVMSLMWNGGTRKRSFRFFKSVQTSVHREKESSERENL
jgi:hypothetical protein